MVTSTGLATLSLYKQVSFFVPSRQCPLLTSQWGGLVSARRTGKLYFIHIDPLVLLLCEQREAHLHLNK